MPFDPEYHEDAPSRAEVDRMEGPVVVEFGASGCGICGAFTPHLRKLLDQQPDIRHVRVEDGPGKPLGRSFRVKLWPTLVFMRDGQVVEQMSRPSPEEAREALERLSGGETGG